VCDHKASWCPPLPFFFISKLALAMTKSSYDKLNGTATTNQLIQDFTVLYIDAEYSFCVSRIEIIITFVWIVVEYITWTRKNAAYQLGPKGPRYLIVQHFSRLRYIIQHNSHKSNNYFLSISKQCSEDFVWNLRGCLIPRILGDVTKYKLIINIP